MLLTLSISGFILLGTAFTSFNNKIIIILIFGESTISIFLSMILCYRLIILSDIIKLLFPSLINPIKKILNFLKLYNFLIIIGWWSCRNFIPNKLIQTCISLILHFTLNIEAIVNFLKSLNNEANCQYVRKLLCLEIWKYKQVFIFYLEWCYLWFYWTHL